MAKHILYNASVVLNSVDLSDHVASVELAPSLGGTTAAAMGDVEDYDMPTTRSVNDVTLNMYQDFASSKTYATLMTLWTNRTTFNAVIKADAGATSATNPAFTIPVYIKKFPIVSGKRGDAHMTQVVLAPAGTMTIA